MRKRSADRRQGGPWGHRHPPRQVRALAQRSVSRTVTLPGLTSEKPFSLCGGCGNRCTPGSRAWRRLPMIRASALLGRAGRGKADPPGALASMPAQDERQGCCAFFQGACSRTAPRTPALPSGASRSIPVSRRDLPRHRRPVIGRRCDALQTHTPTARNGAAGRARGVTRPAPHACHEKRHEQWRFFVGPERKPLIGTCLTPRGWGL